jgi:hypothetical protein
MISSVSTDMQVDEIQQQQQQQQQQQEKLEQLEQLPYLATDHGADEDDDDDEDEDEEETEVIVTTGANGESQLTTKIKIGKAKWSSDEVHSLSLSHFFYRSLTSLPY